MSWVHVSASKLDRVALCPASEAESEGIPDSTGDPGRFGRALHEVLEIAGKESREEATAEAHATALLHGADPIDILEAFEGMSFDPSKGVRPEHEARSDLHASTGSVAGKKLTGAIIDYRDEIEPGHWWVLDYKTGNPDYQKNAKDSLQLLAYGLATMYEKEAKQVTVQVYFPRLGEQGWGEPYTFDRKEGARLLRTIRKIVTEANRQRGLPKEKREYGVGEHCTFCPGWHTCPARQIPVAGAINALVQRPKLKKDGTPGKLMESNLELDVTPGNAVELMRATRYAKKAIELLSERLKDKIAEFGSVPADDGKVLELRQYSRHPDITAAALDKAMDAAGLSDEDQLRIHHHLSSRPKTEYERLDFYKAAEE